MKHMVVPLPATPTQVEKLQALQAMFAQACNRVAEFIQKTRCWHRVTLHRLCYRDLRCRFPELGSQMACNAIYSAARAARLVFQNPRSPWYIERIGCDRPLPLLVFQSQTPVFFDRHTLSIHDGGLSMYTLDGRLHFSLQLASSQIRRFAHEKLCEVVLDRYGEQYRLVFVFDRETTNHAARKVAGELPEYIIVMDMERVMRCQIPSRASEAIAT